MAEQMTHIEVRSAGRELDLFARKGSGAPRPVLLTALPRQSRKSQSRWRCHVGVIVDDGHGRQGLLQVEDLRLEMN